MPLKPLVLLSLVGQVREMALQTKIYFQNMVPEIEKNADYFTAIGLLTFCDTVWSLRL